MLFWWRFGGVLGGVEEREEDRDDDGGVDESDMVSIPHRRGNLGGI